MKCKKSLRSVVAKKRAYILQKSEISTEKTNYYLKNFTFFNVMLDDLGSLSNMAAGK